LVEFGRVDREQEGRGMKDEKLEAIREKDRVIRPGLYLDQDERDRRALLRYVDELRADLASVTKTMLAIREQRDQYSADLAALREAAGKVWCWKCGYSLGKASDASIPCPDCADLRKILGEKP
jgi:rubrerythrin